MQAKVLKKTKDGEWVCEFSEPELPSYLKQYGSIPLPHYILKQRAEKPSDRERYQTVYAKKSGVRGQRPGVRNNPKSLTPQPSTLNPSFSIAAPTAGLHFTSELLEKIHQKGVSLASLTLHIGWGTFKPIYSENFSQHKMLPEYYQISQEACDQIKASREKRGRIIAVGTSATRTLETAFPPSQPGGWGQGPQTPSRARGEPPDQGGAGELKPQKGWADLFIYPGHTFRSVDTLITNFHLPKSTPLLLACAFYCAESKSVEHAEKIRDFIAKYRQAIEHGYRFYSYGDAMLIL